MKLLTKNPGSSLEGECAPEVEKRPIIITFLGRNTQGILCDAQRTFGALENTLVITRKDDQLVAPEGLSSISVDDFIPNPNLKYIILANGGTSVQLLPTIKKLVEKHVQFSAYDMQRDGTVLLMETSTIPEKAKSKEFGEKNQEIIIFLSGNTGTILDDVERHFGDKNSVLVIIREDERLQSPAGLESVTVNSFLPDPNKKYTLIANGGTTAQFLPTLDKLLKAGIEFNAFDLQKDSFVQVW